MANTILQLKKSGVTGNVPDSLAYGELALNYADGKLYYKAANASIASISTGSMTNSFATINANSSLVVATSPTDTLSIIPGNNITISTDTINKRIIINSTSDGIDQFARITANNASSNTVILQGVNATQNTNITTANNAAWAAFAKANNALANTSGAIFGGDLTVTGNLTTSNIYGTLSNTTIIAGNFTTTFDTAGVITHTGNTSSISNSTGALVVTGGVGIKGNVYTGNLVITGTTSNGITFADGTRQITAASGTGTDSFARDTANLAYNQANSATTLAQDAYNYANTISGGGGSLEIVNDNSSNNVYYINFANNTSGSTNTLFTSNNNLTFNPSTGVLNVKSLDVTANSNISSKSYNATGTGQVVIDFFPKTVYRSAFYQIQIESSLNYHILNLNILQNGSNTFSSVFGEVYSPSSLGSFSSDIVGNNVRLLFTPSLDGTVVTFIRNAIAQSAAIPDVPSADLGYIGQPVTITFDAGLDDEEVTDSFDYGSVP